MTLLIDEHKAQTRRKATMAFHKRHGLKSLNDVQAHTLSWGSLNSLQADVAKAKLGRLLGQKANIMTVIMP